MFIYFATNSLKTIPAMTVTVLRDQERGSGLMMTLLKDGEIDECGKRIGKVAIVELLWH